MQRKNEIVYISGGVTGVSDYMERFALAEKKLLEAGYRVFNPARAISIINNFRVIRGEPELTYAECMNYCLDVLVCQCTAIHLLNNWQQSSGAKTEKDCADKLNYPEVYL
jgi:hypothetical protein